MARTTASVGHGGHELVADGQGANVVAVAQGGKRPIDQIVDFRFIHDPGSRNLTSAPRDGTPSDFSQSRSVAIVVQSSPMPTSLPHIAMHLVLLLAAARCVRVAGRPSRLLARRAAGRHDRGEPPRAEVEGAAARLELAGSPPAGPRRPAVEVRSRRGERLHEDVGRSSAAIRLRSFGRRCCGNWATATRSAGRATTWSPIRAASATSGPSGSRICTARSCTTSPSAASSPRRRRFRWWAWCAGIGPSSPATRPHNGGAVPSGVLGYYNVDSNRITLYDMGGQADSAELATERGRADPRGHAPDGVQHGHPQPLLPAAEVAGRGAGDAVRGARRVRFPQPHAARRSREPAIGCGRSGRAWRRAIGRKCSPRWWPPTICSASTRRRPTPRPGR